MTEFFGERDFNGEEAQSPERLAEWRAELTEALRTVGFDEVLIGGCVDVEILLSFVGDERMYEELNDKEKETFLEILRENLGYGSESRVVREYEMEATGGPAILGTKIGVEVFETTEEEVYLRRYTYSDGEVRWSLGPEHLPDEEGG